MNQPMNPAPVQAPEQSGGSMKWLLIVLAIVVVAFIAVWYFMK